MLPKRRCHRRELRLRPMHQVPVRADGEPFHVDGHHAVLSSEPVQRVPRDHTEPEAARNGLFDGFIAAELQADVGLELVHPKELVSRHSGPGPDLA